MLDLKKLASDSEDTAALHDRKPASLRRVVNYGARRRAPRIRLQPALQRTGKASIGLVALLRRLTDTLWAQFGEEQPFDIGIQIANN